MKLRKARQMEEQLEGHEPNVLQMGPALCTSQGQTLSQAGTSKSSHLRKGKG